MSDTQNFRSRKRSSIKEHQVIKGQKRKPYILADENAKSFHKTRDSLLSSSSGFTNYRGLLNLCVVLLIMSSGRLVLENILKYGLLVRFDVPFEFIMDPTGWPSALALLCTNVFIFISVEIERLLEKDKIKEKHGNFLSVFNIFLSLFLPPTYLWYRKANPVSSCFALICYTCLSMKLWSYFSVNRAHRYRRNNGLIEKPDSNNNTLTSKEKKYQSELENLEKDQSPPRLLVEYPNNLNFADIYYFVALPTLCYEINFPRTKSIRKRFLFKRIAEMVFLFSLWFILLQQWMIPIIMNSKVPFREANMIRIFERLLKLAVPNHVCWLIAFYTIFHSYFNILAEILRFGDREFYKEWWNAQSVGEFWKNWNIPVHNFCSRHIYKPLLSFGVTKFQAQLVVFFISAFLHEYIVSIPLRMFKLWSFLGMIGQLPFAFIVTKYLHGNYGNMAIWLSLIIGQPLAIFMYMHDYYIDYFSHDGAAV